MNLIETKPVGDANFYKFSVDFTGDDFILGGKTLPLGIITHDILNIPADKLLYIFKTGDKLNDLYNRLNAENYSDELFTSIRKTVEKILDIIGKIKPFSYFNISEECEHIDLLLSEAFLPCRYRISILFPKVRQCMTTLSFLPNS